jgi:hypothetical protein
MKGLPQKLERQQVIGNLFQNLFELPTGLFEGVGLEKCAPESDPSGEVIGVFFQSIAAGRDRVFR